MGRGFFSFSQFTYLNFFYRWKHLDNATLQNHKICEKKKKLSVICTVILNHFLKYDAPKAN